MKANRREISIWLLVILAIAIGFIIKNVKIGFIIGGLIGLLAGSFAGGRR